MLYRCLFWPVIISFCSHDLHVVLSSSLLGWTRPHFPLYTLFFSFSDSVILISVRGLVSRALKSNLQWIGWEIDLSVAAIKMGGVNIPNLRSFKYQIVWFKLYLDWKSGLSWIWRRREEKKIEVKTLGGVGTWESARVASGENALHYQN